MNILYFAIAQIPPTPTPYPPGTPQVDVPPEFSLWAGAPQAIQSWNALGDARYVLQAILLIGLIIAGMYVLLRFAQRFSKQDSEK